MGGEYPLKPMSVYATIWDGSTWATSGGKYKASYKYAPFIAEFSDLVLMGCRTSPLQEYPSDQQCSGPDSELAAAEFSTLSPRKRASMRRFREKYMTYSFCYDVLRYPDTLPDCDVIPSEKERFWKSGDTKFIVEKKRRGWIQQWWMSEERIFCWKRKNYGLMEDEVIDGIKEEAAVVEVAVVEEEDEDAVVEDEMEEETAVVDE
ncbi:uncharacterized protein A4U43_C04F12010 [Asparagus officinalis]|uniref:Xyloglucan endotransglucosylase/hydrolase n=1 Tax=Asparagus officinalis TaxID=4686 RepID=A0A5P1F213_ASPOF|nr:uncharacterized protein A4U43_C04F12010 [Asparagus officinalis]